MDTKRGSNKKAEITTTNLVITMIILAVLTIVVIVFITNFSEKAESTIDLLPEELQTVATACINIRTALPISYCTEFEKIELRGKTQYVSCEFPEIQKAIIEAQKENDFTIPTCDQNEREKKCKELAETGKLKPDTLVNGVLCDDPGTVEIKIENTNIDGALEINKDFTIKILAQRVFISRDEPEPIKEATLDLRVTVGGANIDDEVITNGEGVAEAKITPTKAGTLKIDVSLKNNPGISEPITLTVEESSNQ